MTDTPQHDETPNGGGDLLPRDPATPTAPASTPAGPRLSRNRKFALLGGTAAIIGLGAIAAPVVAQTITGGDDERGAKHEQFERDLAAKPGVPQAQVERAIEAMQGDRLGQRVDELQQSGALTAEQATAIKSKVASGDVAGALTELRAAMSAQRLDALVTAGTITQAQADQVATLIAAGVPIGLGGPGRGHDGPGRGGERHGEGMGGGHHRDGGSPQNGEQQGQDGQPQNGQFQPQSLGDGNA